MNFRKYLLSLFLSCCFLIVSAQEFDFNSNCKKAYNNIISLKLDRGRFLLQEEQKLHPTNLIPILLYNYIDFLEIYTSGSVKLYEEKKKDFDDRIGILKDGDKSSPYYLYCQAEVHTQSAVLHIKFGEYIATIFDVKRGLKKLESNQDKFPDFIPNQKSLGMLYAILGSIPEQYQNSLDFLGLKGDVTKGMDMLHKAVVDTTSPFQHEAATIKAFMLLHIQNEPNKAWNTLQENNFDPLSNLMDAYSLGHIGIYGNFCSKGIAALQSKPVGEEFASFPLTNFLLGIGKSYKQDMDANSYFQKFLNENIGEDYIKSAWHKMAWNELIHGNVEGYNSFMAKVATNGRAVIDTDKQAEKELENHEIPNPILLKARLLTDGNYLERALVILKQNTVNSFKSKHHKTEYFYRLARIYDKSLLEDKAIQYYAITIVNGKNVPYYYAANSAYLLGFLYEKKNNREEALKNYNLCLALDGHEYDHSIHQKAEAAINRLNH